MSAILEAHALVHGDRARDYGDMRENFARVAGLLTALLGERLNEPIRPEDIPSMMICLKLSRLQATPGHRDSWVDVAGYAECGATIAGAPE